MKAVLIRHLNALRKKRLVLESAIDRYPSVMVNIFSGVEIAFTAGTYSEIAYSRP